MIAAMKRLSTVFKRKSSQQVPTAAAASKSEGAAPLTSSTKATIAAATADKPKAVGPFLGAIDQGTTSSRFLVFDKSGVVIAQHQLEFNQYHQHSG